MLSRKFFLLALTLLALTCNVGHAHTWLRSNSRAHGKASNTWPFRPRRENDVHVQLGDTRIRTKNVWSSDVEGDKMIVKWATAHRNYYYITIIAGKDQDYLYNPAYFTEVDDYIKKGTEAGFNEAPERPRYHSTMKIGNKAYNSGTCDEGCPENMFVERIHKTDKRWLSPYNAPTGEQFKYNPAMIQSDRRVSWDSEEYPYIRAAFRYSNIHSMHADYDMVEFEIPRRLDGGNHYIVHWMWKGDSEHPSKFFDAIDVHVFDKPVPANIRYGKYTGRNTFNKIDHCQFIEPPRAMTKVYDATENIDQCMAAVKARGRNGGRMRPGSGSYNFLGIQVFPAVPPQQATETKAISTVASNLPDETFWAEANQGPWDTALAMEGTDMELSGTVTLQEIDWEAWYQGSRVYHGKRCRSDQGTLLKGVTLRYAVEQCSADMPQQCAGISWNRGKYPGKTRHDPELPHDALLTEEKVDVFLCAKPTMDQTIVRTPGSTVSPHWSRGTAPSATVPCHKCSRCHEISRGGGKPWTLGNQILKFENQRGQRHFYEYTDTTVTVFLRNRRIRKIQPAVHSCQSEGASEEIAWCAPGEKDCPTSEAMPFWDTILKPEGSHWVDLLGGNDQAPRLDEPQLVAQITFQKKEATALSNGDWVRDTGDAFKQHPNGQKFGWRCGKSTVDGQTYGASFYQHWQRRVSDPVNFDTGFVSDFGVCEDGKVNEWELEVENGVYAVTIGRDPRHNRKFDPSIGLFFGCTIENVQSVGDPLHVQDKGIVEVLEVEVLDGRLTLSQYKGPCDQMNWVKVERVGSKYPELWVPTSDKEFWQMELDEPEAEVGMVEIRLPRQAIFPEKTWPRVYGSSSQPGATNMPAEADCRGWWLYGGAKCYRGKQRSVTMRPVQVGTHANGRPIMEPRINADAYTLEWQCEGDSVGVGCWDEVNGINREWGSFPNEDGYGAVVALADTPCNSDGCDEADETICQVITDVQNCETKNPESGRKHNYLDHGKHPGFMKYERCPVQVNCGGASGKYLRIRLPGQKRRFPVDSVVKVFRAKPVVPPPSPTGDNIKMLCYGTEIRPAEPALLESSRLHEYLVTKDPSNLFFYSTCYQYKEDIQWLELPTKEPEVHPWKFDGQCIDCQSFDRNYAPTLRVAPKWWFDTCSPEIDCNPGFASTAGATVELQPGVYFHAPGDGSEVKSPVYVDFANIGLTVEAREQDEDGNFVAPAAFEFDPSSTSGQYHLLVDHAGPIAAGEKIPQSISHGFYFEDGGVSARIPMSAGEHTLTLQFGDLMHRSLGPAFSATVQVTVVGDGEEIEEEPLEDLLVTTSKGVQFWYFIQAASGGVSYPDMEAQVGQRIVFQTSSAHDVTRAPNAEAWERCHKSIEHEVLAANVSEFAYTVTDADAAAGAIYFYCGAPNHCRAGQKVKVSVVGGTRRMEIESLPAPL